MSDFVYLICLCCCMLFIFFYKQKTAYEVRISDWSSDVCSSDLQGRATLARPAGRAPPCLPDPPGICQAVVHEPRRGGGEAAARRGGLSRERKSVVEGKGVSIRVDIGRSRINKTKMKKK